MLPTFRTAAAPVYPNQRGQPRDEMPTHDAAPSQDNPSSPSAQCHRNGQRAELEAKQRFFDDIELLHDILFPAEDFLRSFYFLV